MHQWSFSSSLCPFPSYRSILQYFHLSCVFLFPLSSCFPIFIVLFNIPLFFSFLFFCPIFNSSYDTSSFGKDSSGLFNKSEEWKQSTTTEVGNHWTCRRTHNHVIGWDEAVIIDKEPDKTTRWLKEAIWIRSRGKANYEQGWGAYTLDPVYDQIITKRQPKTLAMSSS